jgi:hypothetical protein
MRIYIFKIYVIEAVRHFFPNKLYQQTNLLYKLTMIKNNKIKKIDLYFMYYMYMYYMKTSSHSSSWVWYL